MELIQDRGSGHYVDSYGDGRIEVDKTQYVTSLIVVPKGDVQSWRPRSLAELTAEDLQPLLASGAKIVVLGTGKTFEFPDIKLLAPFYAAHIGVEVMDTAAACRTYNLLMSEERAVVAGLLVE